MIVKPYISFLSRASDPDLIVMVGGIVTSMTGNAHYPAPAPALPVISAALDEFAQAVANAADGGRTLTAIKNARRTALTTLVRQLATYVQLTCNGNMAVLISSGFPVQKPQRQSPGIPTAPSNLVVKLGLRTGELDAVATPVPGAVIYNWQLSREDEPTVVLQSAQTTAARNTFTGLMPGVIYRATVNAVSSAGPGNWSVPVARMVV